MNTKKETKKETKIIIITDTVNRYDTKQIKADSKELKVCEVFLIAL